MEIRWLHKFLIIIIQILIMTSIAFSLEQNLNSQKKLNNNNNNKNENLEHHNNNQEYLVNNNEALKSNQPHSRKKRLIWVTDDGRLALPPGTSLSITPTISLPLVRYPPEGFLANISFSFPISMDFDKFGLTDNQNPLGDVPLFSARSFGKAAGSMLGNYIASYLNYRTKRDLTQSQTPKMNNENFKLNFVQDEDATPPKLPNDYKHAFHGGERALLYTAVEDFLSTFGLNGRACLLRTICEMHSRSVHSYGFFGEAIKLFLTPTKSPYADLLTEHVRAQKIGEGKLGPGECFPYYKDCSQGIFRTKQSYGKDYNDAEQDQTTNDHVNDDDDNDVNLENEISKSIKNSYTLNNKKLNNNLYEVFSM